VIQDRTVCTLNPRASAASLKVSGRLLVACIRIWRPCRRNTYIEISTATYYDMAVKDSISSQELGKQFLRFSTIQIEDQWWRAEIGREEIAWVQQNLGHNLDGRQHFRAVAQEVSLPVRGLYPGCPWTDRIVYVEGEKAPTVLIPLGKKYSFREAYVKARNEHDPDLSPHGLFRSLEPGCHKHAFQFMKEFGPLFINAPNRLLGEPLWISLAEFWNRHARFVTVAKLWEDRFDPDKLSADWTAIGEQHEKLNAAGAAPLGYIPDSTHGFVRLCPKLPWERDGHELELLQSHSFLRQLVCELLHCELILNTQDCVQTWTRKTVPHEESVWDEMFEPTRAYTSLWSAIWELFGLDTRQYGWKICQICGRFFYPRDRRSVCCSTEHQSLWSKRMWAQQYRASERNRKKRTDKQKKNHTKKKARTRAS
jgi:hypothetical protein